MVILIYKIMYGYDIMWKDNMIILGLKFFLTYLNLYVDMGGWII